MMPFIPGAGRTMDERKKDEHTARNGAGHVPSGATTNGHAAVTATGATGASALLAPVSTDLAAVEDAIQDVANVDLAVLSSTLRLILSAGGKRLRPALVVLAARLHENTLNRRVRLAVAAELLHTATLAHDDVLDDADARRGKPTINASFRNTLAVLTGDYLFGKSGELVASLDDPAIMGIFSWAVMEVVKGEMLRPYDPTDLDRTERGYLDKIRGKTAALFAMCTKTGAMLDARDTALAARMHDYGMALGMAFQIADDVLDFTATEAQLGKPVGSDLRQGTITLPTINFLRHHPDHPIVRALLAHEEPGEDAVRQALDAIRASGAVEAALDRAREYAATAVRAVDGIGHGPIQDTMRRLATYSVERHE